jgi:uncharacterized protein
MKKLIIPILLMFILSIPVFAASDRIVDNAGLLTLNEERLLEEQAAAIVEQYAMDVVIVTVMSTNGRDAQAYADDYYDQNGYGVGANHSGVLLLLVMDTREWVISTCGDALDTMSSFDADELFESVSSYISEGQYYDGFSHYLQNIPPYLVKKELSTVAVIGFALLIGAAAGGIVLLIMRSGMKTAKPQADAGTYVKSGTYDLVRHSDFYLYSTVTKVRKESNNSSGGHRSSSGRSHGGSRGGF